jgi:hypothetical protein
MGATSTPPCDEQRVRPHVIEPTAVYSVAEAVAALRLRQSTIRRELREGRLRVAKRAGRYYLLGKWLLAWIEGGEVCRRKGYCDPTLNGTE